MGINSMLAVEEKDVVAFGNSLMSSAEVLSLGQILGSGSALPSTSGWIAFGADDSRDAEMVRIGAIYGRLWRSTGGGAAARGVGAEDLGMGDLGKGYAPVSERLKCEGVY
ncbi:transcriptional regulator [Striga asiatica]|uniref:Transcriptional regulator n=1 Tax=Striga asiatica TaxID=4170 RepID=A0A5A7R0B4_STRAF|nr:transcriptional regulator [Striga asiatica]